LRKLENNLTWGIIMKDKIRNALNQNGQISVGFRCYITSLESNAKKIAEAVRGHSGMKP